MNPSAAGLVWLHLRALLGKPALSTVNRFFVLTAGKSGGAGQGLSASWKCGGIAQDPAFDAFLEEYKDQGYRALSHSQRFAHYTPAYRVVKSDFAPLLSACSGNREAAQERAAHCGGS